METINKTWFKNRLRKELFLVKCTMKLTDDYSYDAGTNFGKTEWQEVNQKMFSDWLISASNISGDKNGIIELCFASCEYYKFQLKAGE